MLHANTINTFIFWYSGFETMTKYFFIKIFASKMVKIKIAGAIWLNKGIKKNTTKTHTLLCPLLLVDPIEGGKRPVGNGNCICWEETKSASSRACALCGVYLAAIFIIVPTLANFQHSYGLLMRFSLFP